MALPLQTPSFDFASYLTWEAEQAERHEFVAGEVYARTGAEDRHITVAGNVCMALRQHLQGAPCRVYMSDMKLHVAAADSVFYPDVMVTCSASDHASRLVKSEPMLLIEVLSPSTAAYDRGAKFAHYRRIDSLREYVLVDPETRCTDVYRKNAEGLWVLHPFEAAQLVQLASVGVDIAAAQLFADVDPPELAQPV